MERDHVTSTGDLSSKARIRRAAMGVVASKGAERATVREIAAASGLAPGLITHHFGGKKGLIDAVDESIVRLIDGYLSEVPLTGTDQEMSAASDAAFRRSLEENPDVAAYVTTALVQGEHSTEPGLLERLTDLTVEHSHRIRATSGSSTLQDERQSALKTLMRQYGELVLQPVVDRMWTRLTDADPEEERRPRVAVRVWVEQDAPAAVPPEARRPV